MPSWEARGADATAVQPSRGASNSGGSSRAWVERRVPAKRSEGSKLADVWKQLQGYGLDIKHFWELYVGGPFHQALSALKTGAFLQPKFLGSFLGGMLVGMILGVLISMVTAGLGAVLEGTRLAGLIAKLQKAKELVAQIKAAVGTHLQKAQEWPGAKLKVGGAYAADKARGIISGRTGRVTEKRGAAAILPLAEGTAVPVTRGWLKRRLRGTTRHADEFLRLLKSGKVDVEILDDAEFTLRYKRIRGSFAGSPGLAFAHDTNFGGQRRTAIFLRSSRGRLVASDLVHEGFHARAHIDRLDLNLFEEELLAHKHEKEYQLLAFPDADPFTEDDHLLHVYRAYPKLRGLMSKAQAGRVKELLKNVKRTP